MEYFYKFDNRCLCPLEKRFLPKIKEWRNAQVRFLRQFKPLTDFHQERWHAHLKEDKNQVLFALMAGIPPKLDFIGYSGIVNIDYKNRRGELSFLVNPTRVRKREMYKRDFLANLNMLCHYGFEELNLNKLFSETFDFRKDHIKMLKDFGFHTDGKLRQHYFSGGKYCHSIIQSILLSEWKKKVCYKK